MKALFLVAVFLAPALSGVEGPALSAVEGQLPIGKLALSASTPIAEIDIDKLKGQPAKLAWSPDGKELYLQLLDGPFGKPAPERHIIYTVADRKQKSVDAAPAWAIAYWNRKIGQASPDDPAFKIGLETSQRTERGVTSGMGGDLARGSAGGAGGVGEGGGTSTGDAIAAAAATQTVTVHAMKLAGETIGEFVNSVIVPGLTFGWGPAGSKAIVFAKAKGGEIVIMDNAKNKQELDGTKDALLPALSDDGSKLAWVRRDGRKKFSLLVANVSPR